MNVRKEMNKYLNKFPTSVPSGKVMMHNHVRHTIDMPLGLNGFRAWIDTAPPNEEFKPCHCGWSNLPHYSVRPDTPCLKAVKGMSKEEYEATKAWLSRKRYAPLLYTVNK
jgi:hypothetical protein